MTRTILAMALLAGVSSLAVAQTSTTPSTGGATTTQQTPSTGGTGATGTTGATGGATTGGASRGMSMSDTTQIKSQLESQGYSNVTLQPDPSKQGQHKGSAMKAGKQVQIHVDENGRVTEQQ